MHTIEHDIEGAVFIRFAMVGRPVLNGLAGKGQRRRCLRATSCDRCGGSSPFAGKARSWTIKAVEEFLAAAIWEIPVEDFVALVGVDAGPRDRTKRAMSKTLADWLTAEFEVASDPAQQ